jgi:hypothetical protein
MTRSSVNNVRIHPDDGDLLDLGGTTLWRARLRRGTWGSGVRCSRFERVLGGVGFLTRSSVNNVRRHPDDGDLLDCGGGLGTVRPTGHALASAATGRVMAGCEAAKRTPHSQSPSLPVSQSPGLPVSQSPSLLVPWALPATLWRARLRDFRTGLRSGALDFIGGGR